MKLLADHDVYGTTIRFLRNLGHDVFTAAEAGLAQAEDDELLQEARGQGRIFISRDRDFGALIFATHSASRSGVVYLRVLPSTQNAVHAELRRILERHTQEDLLKAFVVVGPGRHRLRSLPRE